MLCYQDDVGYVFGESETMNLPRSRRSPASDVAWWSYHIHTAVVDAVHEFLYPYAAMRLYRSLVQRTKTMSLPRSRRSPASDVAWWSYHTHTAGGDVTRGHPYGRSLVEPCKWRVVHPMLRWLHRLGLGLRPRNRINKKRLRKRAHIYYKYDLLSYEY